MKRLLPYLLLLLIACPGYAQVTAPVIKAGVGVEADLRSNFFNGADLSGNDDWFPNIFSGSGEYLIDTTGAAAMIKRYLLIPQSRKWPFSRGMRFPTFSLVNNRLLIDAIFIRDFHGDDSTVFASGANKNCMSPQQWSTPVSQGIPDKNDILDAYVHVRRDGTSLSDSLWLMGGISIDNTNGNRYFDFEFYQTDLVYDRPNLKFEGYGPDAGHTSWIFDSTGKVIRPGDIIFTANYPSSALTHIEARIWIDSASLSIQPAAFNWGGAFDGATNGARFGYASILPKTPGDFFTGLQCNANTWAGSFNLILQDESMVTSYIQGQYMEFSVNMSKLGLDPFLNSNEPCQLPFSKVLIKSRASTSFTAQLKDFVGPFSFFQPARVSAAADLPIFCGATGISTLSVINPLPASRYTWYTPDGHISSGTNGPAITVDKPGTYIVNQELMTGCGSTYASDTLTILADPTCVVLKSSLKNFQVAARDMKSTLQWTLSQNLQVRTITIERSTDNRNFQAIGELAALPMEGEIPYLFSDELSGLNTPMVFYRLRVNDISGKPLYSKIVALTLNDSREIGVSLMPNPVKTHAYLRIHPLPSPTTIAEVMISDHSGNVVRRSNVPLYGSTTTVMLDGLETLPCGAYVVTVKVGSQQYVKRMIRAY